MVSMLFDRFKKSHSLIFYDFRIAFTLAPRLPSISLPAISPIGLYLPQTYLILMRVTSFSFYEKLESCMYNAFVPLKIVILKQAYL